MNKTAYKYYKQFATAVNVTGTHLTESYLENEFTRIMKLAQKKLQFSMSTTLFTEDTTCIFCEKTFKSLKGLRIHFTKIELKKPSSTD